MNPPLVTPRSVPFPPSSTAVRTPWRVALLAGLSLLASAPLLAADPTPDLVVTNLTINAGQPVYWDEDLVVQWTILNLGDGAVTNDYFHDRVTVLGTNGASDTLVNKLVIHDSGPIPPGGSQARQFTLRLDPRTFTRDYAVQVTTDTAKRVIEYNESGTAEANNTSDVQVITIGPRLHPDLVVVSVTLPPEVYTATPFDLTWVVENAGTTVASGPWADRFRMRRSTVPAFTTMAEFAISGPVAPGDRVTNIASVTLEAHLTPGSYAIEMETDFANAVPEFDGEGNNALRYAPVQVLRGVIPHPDLVVDAVKPPLEAYTEQAVPVTWTVRNQGTLPVTNAWDDAVWLYPNASLTNGRKLGTFRYNAPLDGAPLGPGEQVERTVAVTVPTSGTTPGDYWFGVQTDLNGFVVEEEHETNNVTAASLSTRVHLPLHPDLRVSAVTAPAAAFAGLETVVEWAVTNAGTASTSARSWDDAVWLSANTTLDAADRELGRVKNATFLGVGGAYGNRLAVTLPPALQGRFYLIVRTDERDQVEEYEDETNNTKASRAVQVTIPPAPDLVVSNVQAPAVTFVAQRISVTYSVFNTGTAVLAGGRWVDVVHVSTNEVLDGPDKHVYWATRTDDLAPGQGYTNTITGVVPPDYLGTCHLLVTTDFNTGVEEQANEGNNTAARPIEILPLPPPDLEARLIAAPAEVRGGLPFTVTYSVTNHGAGHTLRTSWVDSLYLSTNDTYETGQERPLYSAVHVGALDPGQGYTNAITVPAPFLTGPFHALVRTDSSDSLEESAETNNVAVTIDPLQFTSIPADLRVTEFLAPATAPADGTLILSWKVRNSGPADSGASSWEDHVILSRDGVEGNADDFRLGSAGHTGVVQADGEYVVTDYAVKLPATFGPGTHTLWLAVDPRREVYEETRTNNYAARSLTLVGGHPDLQVAQITHPGLADAGAPRIGWTIQNFGDGPTRADWWRDRVYLSVDAVLDPSDTLVLESTRANPLPSGASYQETNSFSLDPLDPGPYYVIVDTDCLQQVDESNAEQNNVRASDAPLVIPPPPDLAVLHVDAPTEAISGLTFQVSGVITNQGGRKAEGLWTDAVYLSADQVFDRTTDVPAGWAYRLRDLLKGESYTQVIEATVPDGLSGPLYAFLVTDPHDGVLESGPAANNRAYDPLAIMVRLQPPTDLVAGLIEIPTNVWSGLLASFTFSVENRSTHNAVGSWTDALFLSADATWDLRDELIARVEHQGDVPAGGGYTNIVTAPLPGVAPGRYYVIVRSDIRNRVPEPDEQNNFAASLEQVTTDIPELAPGIPAAGTLSEGQAAFYKLPTRPGETLEILLDGAAPAGFNELYIRFGAPPNRTQFDWIHETPNEPDQRLVVPVTQAGTYYLLVYANSAGRTPQAYSIAARYLDFGISQVEPNAGGNVGQVTVRIRGALFDPDTRVELRNNDRSIPASWSQWVDPALILATFDLRGVPPGPYGLYAVTERPDMFYFKPLDRVIEYVAVYGEHLVANAFRVEEGGGPDCQAELLLPAAARIGRIFPAYLEVVNRGNTDLPVPVYVVSSPNGTPLAASLAELTSPRGTRSTKEHLLVLGSVRPEVLIPGERVRVPIHANALHPEGAEFVMRRLAADGGPVDWPALEEIYRDYGDANWSRTWANFLGMVGTTWTDLESAMRTMGLQLASGESVPFLTGDLLLREILARAAFGLPLEAPTPAPPPPAATGCCGGNLALDRVFVDRGTGQPLFVNPGAAAAHGSGPGNPAGSGANLPRLHSDDGVSSQEWAKWCYENPSDCVWWDCSDVPATFPELLLADAVAWSCAKYGIAVAVSPSIVWLWKLYLSTTPTEPAPEIEAYDDPGTPLRYIGLDFASAKVVANHLKTRLQPAIVRAFPHEDWTTCLSIAGGYDLEEFLGYDPSDPDFETLIQSDTTHSNLFRPALYFGSLGEIRTIPGNLAGGPGTGCGRSDARRFKGSMLLAPTFDKCGNLDHIKAAFFTRWTVTDCIDFCPGDLGASWEQLCSRPMSLLEANGEANDVPLTVRFSKWHTFTVNTPLPECESPCRHMPPDPCSEECNCNQSEDPDPTPPDPERCRKHHVPGAGAVDPNDITGPAGVGPERWVNATHPLPYTIRFENDPLLASAPAQTVHITQQLDPTLDWRSFRLGQLSFGDQLIDVPPNRAFFQSRLDLRTTHGIFLDVIAGVDVTTGLAFWQFTSVDPLTGGPPADPMAGFLPPNLLPPQGEGSVTYSIRPRADAPTRSRIEAQARIVFDLEPPIDTPPVFNTLDSGVPDSAMQPLPPLAPEPLLALDWSGADDPGGSAVAGYDLFVSVDGRPLELLLDQTPLNGTLVTAQPGHTYAFYTRAHDHAGNIQPLRPVPDAQTALPDPAPYLWPIPDQAADEDTPVLLIPITVQDTVGPVDQLLFRVHSSNPALVPPDAVAVTGTGTQRVLHLAPVADQHGQTTVTLTLQSPTGTFARSFEVVIQPVNDPPVATPDEFLRLAGAPLHIPAYAVLLNDRDPEGGILQVAGVTGRSRNGGIVRLANGQIEYTPPAGNDTDDTFTCRIADDAGALAFADVSVLVERFENGRSRHQLQVEALPDGSARISFTGIPGHPYRLEASPQLDPSAWETVATRSADEAGQFEYVTPGLLPGEARYYRSVTDP